MLEHQSPSSRFPSQYKPKTKLFTPEIDPILPNKEMGTVDHTEVLLEEVVEDILGVSLGGVGLDGEIESTVL